jgi:hypothetical protein
MRDGLSLNIRSDDQQDSYAAMSITDDPEDRIVVLAVDVPNARGQNGKNNCQKGVKCSY